MPCFFCSNKNHASENCNIYPTLQSRYSNLKYCMVPCLCRRIPSDPEDILYYVTCGCRNFCEVCLQSHHIALCPKRDPSHQFYTKQLPDSINLFNLGYHVVKRFMALCNPIDKIKLHLSCKYLNLLKPLSHKLYETPRLSSFNKNIIGNGCATIGKKLDTELLQKKIYPNFMWIEFKKRNITKSDVQILSTSDPVYAYFLKCQLANDLNFRDFLQSFPYILVTVLSYSMLPKTWIKDLTNVKRNVNLRTLYIFTDRMYPKINVNEFVELLKTHKDLFITFNLEYGLNFTTAWKKIEAMMKHERFALTSNRKRCRVKFWISGSPIMFSFNRNGLS